MQPKQRLPFLSFHTFSLSRPPPHSLTTPSSLPLSAEESGPSIGIEAPLKVIQKCTARCLHSPPFPPLSTYRPTLPVAPNYPPPSAPTHLPSPLEAGEGWIHGGQPCSKSRPGLNALALGLKACPPLAPEGWVAQWEKSNEWRGRRGDKGEVCLFTPTVV